VRSGDFAAIPEGNTFEGSAGLAMMIDGYGVGGDPAACRAILDRVLAPADKAEKAATALDLWIALFAAHRAARHAGIAPQGDELQRLDTLARRLRSALLTLPPMQKAGIMAAMDGDTYWKSEQCGRG
jgi:hypothetical protein